MPVVVQCPGCSSRLNAPDAAAGKTLKCPKCQGPVTVPAPQPAAPAGGFEVVDEEPAPAKPAGKGPAAPVAVPDVEVEDDPDDRPRRKRPRGEDDDEEDEDDRPRKKKRKKTGPPPGVVIAAASACVLLLAGGAFAVYWFQFREQPKSAGTAETKPDTTPPPQGQPPRNLWMPYQPVGAGFRVSMVPGAVEVKSKPPAAAGGITTTDGGAVIPEWKEHSSDVRLPELVATKVVVITFPANTTAADQDKYVSDTLKALVGEGPKGRTPKEARRGPTTLAGKAGTEVVYELDLGGLPPPGGAPPGGLPQKLAVVARWVVAENRAYLLVLLGTENRGEDEKAFFGSFQITPETGGK